MTDRIAFEDGEVSFIQETFGGLDTAELTISRDEFDGYELHLDVEGTVLLDEFIAKVGPGGYELDLSSFQTSVVEVREADSDTESDDIEPLTPSLSQNQRSQMPPIPDNKNLETETDYRFYHRLMNNPDSQPAIYRRFIRNEVEIERPRFDRWSERQGFEPETGGSHNASLLVLERIGEIERRGRGENQVIVWVGE